MIKTGENHVEDVRIPVDGLAFNALFDVLDSKLDNHYVI